MTEEIDARRDLLVLLARLPDRQRQVMAYLFDDATPAQIAAELGITQATVRATIRDTRTPLNRYRGKDSR